MFPVVRNTEVLSRRCAWRASLQLMCAVAILAASAGGGAAVRARAVAPAAVKEEGRGGPFIPADVTTVKYSLARGALAMDALRPEPGDEALDLTATM